MAHSWRVLAVRYLDDLLCLQMIPTNSNYYFTQMMKNIHMKVIQNSYHVFDQIYQCLQGSVFLKILTFEKLLLSLRQDLFSSASQSFFDYFESFWFALHRLG